MKKYRPFGTVQERGGSWSRRSGLMYGSFSRTLLM